MLVAIDIGNSSVNIGYFTDRGLVVQKIDTYPLRNIGDYLAILKDFLSENRIEKTGLSGIISSVVRSHSQVFIDALRRLSGEDEIVILTVSHTMNSGLVIKVDAPEKIGTDRIAGSVGASELYGAPVAVLDFGTATTITVVDQRRYLIGGAILPGLGLMNKALHQGTQQLQEVVLEPPDTALGADTSGCIRSGLYYGTAGAVERILTEIENETGVRFNVVLTGGHSHGIRQFMSRPCEINPNLALEGLRILYGKNRPA